MSIEAMKQALEALETWQRFDEEDEQTHEAITYLRQAIAEAEKQEPIGITDDDGNAWMYGYLGPKFPPNTPLYTYPPYVPTERQRPVAEPHKPLTDEQIEKKWWQAELSTLMAISDEYNAWIKHHAAGHSYDDFLSKRAAHGIKGEA